MIPSIPQSVQICYTFFMFEHVPTTPVEPLPAVVPPPRPPAISGPVPPSIRTTPTHPPKPQASLADRATMEMFKRTSLSGVQKIVLIVAMVLVFGALIGGGIWLFIVQDPLTQSSSRGTNSTNATTTTIPLQELDTDKDGVRDIDERRYGSDAAQADSDTDGLNDYLEIYQYDTDPTVADTDGDSYLDGDEVDHGYDPNGPGKL